MKDQVVVEGGFEPGRDAALRIAEIRMFLDYEAEVLDDPRRIREWARLLTDDFVYEVPVRVGRETQSKEPVFPANSLHVYETKPTIERRAARLESGHAWGEEPPSLMRRVIGGMRVSSSTAADELEVRSAFLLYHGRDHVGSDMVAGERNDIVRVIDGRYFLAHRIVYLDHVVIPTQNIVYFL